MTKLLTDKQLEEKIAYIKDTSYSLERDIFDLIQEQKIAHANMVIGNTIGVNRNNKDFYDGFTLAQKESRDRNKV